MAARRPRVSLTARPVYHGIINSKPTWTVHGAWLNWAVANAPTMIRHHCAAIFKEGLRQFSPKLTGALSRRWEVACLPNGTVRIRNKQVYAGWQQYRTRNKKYVNRGLTAAMPSVNQILLGQVDSRSARLSEQEGAVPQPSATFNRRLLALGHRNRAIRPGRTLARELGAANRAIAVANRTLGLIPK